MSTSEAIPESAAVALIVGVGGLGCPAALALAHAGVALRLCDDDRVELHNLHRQILFSEADVGRDKLDAARDALIAAGALEVDLFRERLLPETAGQLMENVAVVVEGADNFATKFLAADAGHVFGVPVVHGAAVRWHGTALLVRPDGMPCYRCLFEDLLPTEAAPSCSTAGVVGPAVGVIGALMADLALDALAGAQDRAGSVFSFDGKSGQMRATRISPRASCDLCGESAQIRSIVAERYWPPTCATLGPAHAPHHHA
jgi:molybdopterin/thiamine biosynthesis adenylyltransferase